MQLIQKMRTYLLEDEFQIRILKGRVNVVNYTSIGHFDSNKVMLSYEDGSVIVHGDNLVVSKLLGDEILITGKIKSIELR